MPSDNYYVDQRADNNAIYNYYEGSGVFDATARNSAVKKLFDVFIPVLGADGGRYNDLCDSVTDMEGLSDILGKTNGSLGYAWENAAQNCTKMEEKIASIIIEIVKVVNSYIEATYAEELKAVHATEQFNNNMDRINNALNEIDNL